MTPPMDTFIKVWQTCQTQKEKRARSHRTVPLAALHLGTLCPGARGHVPKQTLEPGVPRSQPFAPVLKGSVEAGR